MKHKFSTALILDGAIHSFFIVWCAYLLSNANELAHYKVTAFILLILALVVGTWISIENTGFKIFRALSHPEE